MAPAQAVEVPLSRASFDRAVAEGRSCKRLDDARPYLAAHRGTGGALAGMLDGVLQHYTSDVTTQSFVVVHLKTPYTQARRAACEAHLFGGDFDVEALWSRLQTASTILIEVETDALAQGNNLAAMQELGDSSPPATWHSVAGPGVERVRLRRGKDKDAVTIEPLPGGNGFDYEFPATALQGKGTFYALIRTTEHKFDDAVKLKRSILNRP